jgi:hypothetical protein
VGIAFGMPPIFSLLFPGRGQIVEARDRYYLLVIVIETAWAIWSLPYIQSPENISLKGARHRNLITRTSMPAHVLQIFLGKEHLVKNWLICTLHRQGTLLQRNKFFQRSTKPLFTSLNRAEIGWKKLSLFFKHASSSVASNISMG